VYPAVVLHTTYLAPPPSAVRLLLNCYVVRRLHCRVFTHHEPFSVCRPPAHRREAPPRTYRPSQRPPRTVPVWARILSSHVKPRQPTR